ncbi:MULTISPECIES: LysR family transcriptional regulator [Idiomarinaceae]|uniref:DNA-binding transcriptional LysR family regulator n=4 Tax=Pseudidiomarina TaxID=2800384 RepID=A0A368URV9_9GAMM|nr:MULTISPECIES: LysR family transcriptional regulator [Idiomarinaceae]MDT7525995.1 LysR family transcriptional regulator [Pseudidiomarina sp. GXY010]MDX1526747.1 LysR family transcriptional regulator [Pseudidiomarina maritima]MRJ41730.1 LysR family transcriptional regulator [Idiomarina sp. FeN1]NCU57720.1 LysR family transcriptional regulator [Idiomarina sp. FenA--70]NCU60272.1 LysR family transcriptional regulator [Idiomarina sp. FenBw--71]
MDLRQLNYFVAVYENGSISAAARVCNVAQPSLSKALQQLEDELGVALFARQSRGVTPTEDGERLYGHAGRMLSQMQSLRASFRQSVKRVQFRLGLIRALGVERMSQLLREFSAGVEGLELHLVEPEDEGDARIITPKMLKAGEQFLPIWTDNFLVALPAGHPLGLKSSLDLADFDQLALIKRTPCDAWSQLYPELIRNGIQPDIRADIHTIEYALGLVSAGVGVALVPDFEALRERQDVILRPLQGLTLQRTIGLAYPRSKSGQPALEWLRTLCQQRSHDLQ